MLNHVALAFLSTCLLSSAAKPNAAPSELNDQTVYTLCIGTFYGLVETFWDGDVC